MAGPWEKYQDDEDGPWSKYKSDLDTMISNIPASAMKMGRELYSVAKNPGEAVDNISRLGAGAIQKLTGPTPSGEDRTPYADAAWDGLKDRYGSMDNAKRTAIEDPVGFASDTVGLLFGGVSGLSRAGAGVGKAVARMAPDPAEMYKKSAKFSTSLPESTRTRMAQTAVDEGIMPTYKGLSKLDGLIDDLGSGVGKLIDDATASGKAIPKGRLLARLQASASKLDSVTDANYKPKAKQIGQVLRDQVEAWKGVDSLTPRQVQDFKRSLDGLIDHDRAAKTFGGNYKPGRENARMDMRTDAKEALEEIPGVAESNQKLSRLYELRGEKPGAANIQGAANRIENNNAINLQAPVMAGAGAALGGNVGGLAGMAVGMSQMPKPRARMAIIIQKLKSSPYRDLYFTPKGTLTEAGRQVLVQAGRLNQQTDQEATQQ